jgi:hypothetical protein
MHQITIQISEIPKEKSIRPGVTQTVELDVHRENGESGAKEEEINTGTRIIKAIFDYMRFKHVCEEGGALEVHKINENGTRDLIYIEDGNNVQETKQTTH